MFYNSWNINSMFICLFWVWFSIIVSWSLFYVKINASVLLWYLLFFFLFFFFFFFQSYMQIVMGDSNQLQNVEGRFQNIKEEVEYDTLNPDLVEEVNYTFHISKTNTSSDRYKNEHKRKLFNSPILCLIPI